MTTDHYESAYGECDVHLSIDYTERDDTIKKAQFRAFWCPACGRNHNFRLLPDDEVEGNHRLANAEPSSVPDDAKRDEDGEAVLGEFSTESSESDSGGEPAEDTQAEPDSAGDTDEDGEVPVESPPIDPGQSTVSELEDKLQDEDYDWNAAALRGLYESEVNGKARSTALDAIDSRLNRALGGD